jgi:ABC-type glycerol-3-phosphate transport system permease component
VSSSEDSGAAAVNSSIVLISAVLASLATGVLTAYGICMTMFRLFRIHARQVAAEKRARAVVSEPSTVEG